jgi:phosphatidylglycerol---prolipoprotein diacylglyceryl transferase
VLPYIEIAGMRFWTYGLMMGLAFCAGYFFGERDFRRRGIPIPMAVLLPGLIAGGLVGGRLDHILVVQILGHHQRVAWALTAGFFQGGYTYFGGLVGGFAAIVIVARAYRVPLLKVLDGAPTVCLCYGIGRIGCLLAGDGDYGLPTSLPWGMSFPHGLVPTTVRVHPNPLYETAYSVAIFLILWPRGNPERYAGRPHGLIFADALLWTAVCRFCTECVSRNLRWFAGLTEAQWMSIVFLAIATAIRVHQGRGEESRRRTERQRSAQVTAPEAMQH